MLGAPFPPSGFFCIAAEPLLEPLAEGGGDFNRGEIGHVGVVSPDPAAPVLLADLGSLDTASVTGPDCSEGTLVADSTL
jgi:hypothetical protein